MEDFDFDLEMDLELIEFWRGIYAQRRFYLRHTKNYASVHERIVDFQLFAEWLCEASVGGFFDGWDVKRFEVKILEHFTQEGTVSALISKADTEDYDSEMNLSDLDELVRWVLDESVELGYVASDLLMRHKEGLLDTAQSMEEKYWSDQVEEFVKRIEPVLRKKNWRDGVTLSYELKEWGGPRFFGPNAFPAHRLRYYTPHDHEQLFYLMKQSNESVDFMFGIDGIYADDFNLQVTLMEVKREILLDRFVHFIDEMRKIARDIEVLAKRSPKMESVVSLFDRDNYEEWNREKVGDPGLVLITKTILDHFTSKTLRIEGARFLEEDFKDAQDLFAKYRKVKKTLAPILTGVKKLGDAKGPRSNVAAEKSRACGVYLWDCVNVEGMKTNKALDDLRNALGVDDEYSLKDDTTMRRWLRVVDRSIRENLFLSMSDPNV